MHRNGQHESAPHIPHIGDQAFRNRRPRASFYKKALTVVSYATACAVVALGMTYWATSAGNALTKFNVLPAHLTSASDASNRVHKADRLSGLSFEKRWRAVPAPSTVVRIRRQAPRADERIPFSCELAFSRLVTQGNFSTRCIAGLETSPINT